ncbi:hypothetical protein CEP54_015052 [Fusarium duplospermum]|uniref:Uncharacterized protein n=1 Tax=Fusarium duplospermum TaxID=1325734 RepID=A0A428NRV8_9HYPO|nr:hypothetical protein CEP54_015052 [Fusarium duplospermum]
MHEKSRWGSEQRNCCWNNWELPPHFRVTSQSPRLKAESPRWNRMGYKPLERALTMTITITTLILSITPSITAQFNNNCRLRQMICVIYPPLEGKTCGCIAGVGCNRASGLTFVYRQQPRRIKLERCGVSSANVAGNALTHCCLMLKPAATPK